jgi:hypothetical protein
MIAGLLVVVGLEVGRFVGQGIDVSSFGSSEPSRVHAWLVVDDLRRARSSSAALDTLADSVTWKSQISAIGSPSVISTSG